MLFFFNRHHNFSWEQPPPYLSSIISQLSLTIVNLVTVYGMHLSIQYLSHTETKLMWRCCKKIQNPWSHRIGRSCSRCRKKKVQSEKVLMIITVSDFVFAELTKWAGFELAQYTDLTKFVQVNQIIIFRLLYAIEHTNGLFRTTKHYLSMKNTCY